MAHRHEFYSGTDKLVADLYLPGDGGRSTPLPGIVLAHGFAARRNELLPPLAEGLSAAGFAVFTFDYRGLGESEGDEGRIVPQEQCFDIRNAITYFSSLEEIDSERIGIYGTSFGGGNAILAAAQDQRIKCVVSSVSYGDGSRWLRSLRRYWEWCEFRDELRQYELEMVTKKEARMVSVGHILTRDPAMIEKDAQQADPPVVDLYSALAILETSPETIVAQISPRPVMIIGVENDYVVPTDEAMSLYTHAKEPKRIELLPRIGHQGVYTGEGLKRVVEISSGWFEEHLKPPNYM